ncbi:MAG: hypothetical protein LBQ84_06965, partial [Flavobacteriaceae bacterium]|nr:hypothetical protein [Flavobacteriaceae bacterium]
IKVDTKGQVFEYQSKENNLFVHPAPVAIVYSDLTVSSVGIDKALQGGETVTVSWQVENIGTGNIPNVKQTDLIYISTSSTFNKSTTFLLDSLVYFNHLNSSENIIQKKEALVPCFDGDSYYLHVVANAHNTVYEAGNTSNNTGTSAVQSLLTNDLTVEQLSGSTTETGSGQTLDLSWTIKKTGAGTIQNKPLKTIVYLSQNPLSAGAGTELGVYSQEISLQEGETQAFTYPVALPNGIEGTYYISLMLNSDEKICESSFENNSKNSPAITVTLSPSPDLRATALTVPDNLKAGATVELRYTVENKGVAALASETWKDRLFISAKNQLDISAFSLKEIRQNRPLEINGSYEEIVTVQIPPSLTPGNYYLFAFTDEEDEIYEHQAENNNLHIVGPVYVQPYPLDIVAENLTATATTQWQETIPVTFTVRNNSEEKTVQTQWMDAVYLSAKNFFDNTAILLKERKHIGALASGEHYTVSENVVVPNGYTGNYYILCVADSKEINYDINRDNNTVSSAIAVNSTPTPDLVIEDFQVTGAPLSGQPFHVTYTIKNNGAGAVNAQTWNNKIYLSNDATLDAQDEQLKNTLVQNKYLAPGESYTEETSITIALPKTGNYILLLQIDANDVLYEHGGESNNLASNNIIVNLPLPGDLVPENIQSENRLISGNYLHAAWNISNKGDNPVNSSNLKDLVYLSSDTQFDASDKLIGQLSGNVSIPAYSSITRQVTARISGVKEGDYYLLVKTDVMNSVNESDKTNNTAYSAYPIKIELRELPLNTKVGEILENNVPSEWKLSSAGIINETVWVQALSADSLQGAANNLYVKHNDAADNINYDFSSDGQFTANPQLYIPSIQAEYYGINVKGETPVGSQQEIEIQAEVLPFEIRSVSPNYGGNNGRVTVELSGAKFTPEMRVWMEDEFDFFTEGIVQFVDFSKVYVTFDLQNAWSGNVDIVAVLENEESRNRFRIIDSEKVNELSLNLIIPSNPRYNRTISLTLEYANLGLTNIENSIITITSLTGSPISFTTNGLQEHKVQLELSLPSVYQGKILKPGDNGAFTIYCNTINGLLFSIVKSHQ